MPYSPSLLSPSARPLRRRRQGDTSPDIHCASWSCEQYTCIYICKCTQGDSSSPLSIPSPLPEFKIQNTPNQKTMSHYVPVSLVPQVPKTQLHCQLEGCGIAIPPIPYPPPFSLQKADGSQVSPSPQDVRRYFCSEAHRDQVWKTEKGWFDRRAAMPSVRPSHSWKDSSVKEAELIW